MISGTAMTFGHSWNWLVLVALTLAGALVRLWFVGRHGDARRRGPWRRRFSSSVWWW